MGSRLVLGLDAGRKGGRGLGGLVKRHLGGLEADFVGLVFRFDLDFAGFFAGGGELYYIVS